MRFSRQRQESRLPEINLVPMMDVLMTVLTFFIIISMTLNGQAVNVLLPKTNEAAAKEGEGADATLVVGLTANEEILVDGKVVSSTDLVQRMQTYFDQNSEGVVTLKADRSLTYEQVANVLKAMRDVGGGRVSLGIEGITE
jgi:biopolymer transport protein ExbD